MSQQVESQQAGMHDLEKRGAEAESQVRQLREKLNAVEKERRTLSDQLENRERSLRSELDEKERAWSLSAENLREQLTAMKRDGSKKDQGQQALVTTLERQNAEAKTQTAALREQISRLENERQDLVRALDAREQVFRSELDEKQAGWSAAQAQFESQLAAFKRDAQQKTQLRENRILELEQIAAAAAADAQSGREQLRRLESERDTQLEAVRSREKALRKELAEKNRRGTTLNWIFKIKCQPSPWNPSACARNCRRKSAIWNVVISTPRRSCDRIRKNSAI